MRRYFWTLAPETKQVICTRAVYNHMEKSMNGATSRKIKVLRLRLKGKHAKFLRDLAREVNFVWNYCNELQITMFNRERRFLSGYDFAKFTRGATNEGLPLHSQTVQAIAEEFAKDCLHQFSTRLVRGYHAVFVGNVSASALVKTPKGIREWSCDECGAVHDRNVNAARNILAAGRRRLAEGIPRPLRARVDVNSLLAALAE
jgi:hypothetical protein